MSLCRSGLRARECQWTVIEQMDRDPFSEEKLCIHKVRAPYGKVVKLFACVKNEGLLGEVRFCFPFSLNGHMGKRDPPILYKTVLLF